MPALKHLAPPVTLAPLCSRTQMSLPRTVKTRLSPQRVRGWRGRAHARRGRGGSTPSCWCRLSPKECNEHDHEPCRILPRTRRGASHRVGGRVAGAGAAVRARGAAAHRRVGADEEEQHHAGEVRRDGRLRPISPCTGGLAGRDGRPSVRQACPGWRRGRRDARRGQGSSRM